MKKLFYLLVVLAILSAIDHPEINRFYDQTLGQFKMFARESVKSKDVGAAKVFNEMSNRFNRYSEAEQAMIEKITKDNQAILKFRQDYCIGKDFNPVIYGPHQEEFCQVIEQQKHNLKNQSNR